MWEIRSPHTLLMGVKNVQALWKPIWQFLNHLNTELQCDQIILLLGIYQENWKQLFTPTPVHNVHSSTSHNRQKVEITQVSISRWMDKQNAAHPYNGILLSHKKKWSGEFPGSWSGFQALTAGLDSIPGLGIKILQTLQYRFRKKKQKHRTEVLICTTTWMNLKNTKLSFFNKRTDTKVTYYMIPFIWNVQANPQRQKADQWWPGAGGGGMRVTGHADRVFFWGWWECSGNR